MKKLCFALPLIFSAVSFANEPVQRVISLAPHATEIAYAAGLGDKLIAVSEMSDYPEQAKDLEKVSNYQGIKLERIIALQPDLVIAWYLQVIQPKNLINSSSLAFRFTTQQQER